jgi:hypothetical protein
VIKAGIDDIQGCIDRDVATSVVFHAKTEGPTRFLEGSGLGSKSAEVAIVEVFRL